MEIRDLLKRAREIWGEDRMTLNQIIVAMGVVFGTICRWERNDPEDLDKHTEDNLKMKMGHMIFSTIRWCDDLGYDPEECVELALETQKKLVKGEIAGERGYLEAERKKDNYTVKNILERERTIWRKQKLSLEEIIVRIGKVQGDICRWARNYSKDKEIHNDKELKKEFGNIITASICWCDDLRYDPEECVDLAIKGQERYVAENKK